MAYNNYFPQYYPSAAPYNPQPQQPSNGITWVQGIQAAKSYPVAAGQSVLLLDSETSTFYIKSTDQSGMPLPLRIFDFIERDERPSDVNPNQETMFITKQEFESFKDEIRSELKHNSYKPQYKKKEDN